MPAFNDVSRERAEHVELEACPQCGYGEAICSERAETVGERFKTCPRCGCSEASDGGQTRRWKGYGVFVLESGRGLVKAGAFPRQIPDEKVTRIVERFSELGSSVRYVTRWNETEHRVEVLLGADR